MWYNALQDTVFTTINWQIIKRRKAKSPSPVRKSWLFHCKLHFLFCFFFFSPSLRQLIDIFPLHGRLGLLQLNQGLSRSEQSWSLGVMNDLSSPRACSLLTWAVWLCARFLLFQPPPFPAEIFNLARLHHFCAGWWKQTRELYTKLKLTLHFQVCEGRILLIGRKAGATYSDSGWIYKYVSHCAVMFASECSGRSIVFITPIKHVEQGMRNTAHNQNCRGSLGEKNAM